MGDGKEEKQEATGSSDEDLVNGITTPHGPAAWGRTHPGGNKGYLYPRKCRSTSHRSTSHRSFTHLTRIHHQPVTGQPVSIQINASQSITSHQSLDRKTDSREKSVFTCQLVTGHQSIYQPLVSDAHAMSMEFTTNRSYLGSEHSYRHEIQNPTNNSS